ncbi:tachykinin-like peptides receptor 86C isoform X3 [Chelonus insularis]|uniref:tachykinin-like peptides receptor 86C isoform X3 n=1 Tax=Chelonus insularis TaxID=460826 RepID=UPI00158DD997|nr:tachykinin-like peptides receptor 86C isoform X3 [Chelonus insularis]
MSEDCPNCGQLTNDSCSRLIEDSCGHRKCRICLLYEEQGCKTCEREKNKFVRIDGQERPFDLPWWQKLSWSTIFAVILLVATGGNIIVMWIVLAHRRMRTVTNYLLVNLSIADLMMSLLNCIFNFIFMLNSNWPFGVVYCTVNNFVANVTVASSTFTLVVISFDRYMAIMRPLQHHMSRRRTTVALILIWLASALLAMPCLLYSTTLTRRYSNGKSRIVCYMLWPDGDYLNSRSEYIYNLVFLGVTYLIPMIVMAVCYTLMGRKLWGSKSIGEHTQHQKYSMKSKRKVVKMFIVIVTIFAVCWLPYHGFFIFLYHYKNIMDSSYVQHVYLSFYWLAMSNAMVNPLIYYWMNNRFRMYFQQIICRCCCIMSRTNSSNYQMQEIAGLRHSDTAPSQSDRFKSMSIRWRQNTAKSHVQALRVNSRSICDKIQHQNAINI